jgi:ketosteroid isomerase-like protein
MKNLLFPLVGLLFLIACNKTKTSSLDQNDIDEVKRTMFEYREAWRAGDSIAVLRRICDDVILYMPNKTGKPKIGKDSVAAFWFPPSDVSYPITGYEVTDEKIDISGDLCIYSGISRLTWHIQHGNVHSDTTTSVSEFLNVLRKENDEWKLFRVMYNLKDEGYK